MYLDSNVYVNKTKIKTVLNNTVIKETKISIMWYEPYIYNVLYIQGLYK